MRLASSSLTASSSHTGWVRLSLSNTLILLRKESYPESLSPPCPPQWGDCRIVSFKVSHTNHPSVLTLKKLPLLSERPLRAFLGGELEAMLSSCPQDRPGNSYVWVCSSVGQKNASVQTLQLRCNQRTFLL
ncbi:hypothetical protein EYF80_011948 [Liparis tanakae]|uniref:Uncharacterized protein n=1 Tax=Liparis tanakae TaxID=230148 RepID=A0A4Z2IJF4_9TELE|nr:hypothetical protein EYF80_011948 [Liparis tanakae]